MGGKFICLRSVVLNFWKRNSRSFDHCFFKITPNFEVTANVAANSYHHHHHHRRVDHACIVYCLYTYLYILYTHIYIYINVDINILYSYMCILDLHLVLKPVICMGSSISFFKDNSAFAKRIRYQRYRNLVN